MPIDLIILMFGDSPNSHASVESIVRYAQKLKTRLRETYKLKWGTRYINRRRCTIERTQ